MNKQQEKKVSPKNAGKVFIGEVVSAHTPKTVIVAVSSTYRHPLYKKAVRRTKRFSVHNESLELAVGDMVRIQEVKPISRMKHSIVLEKIK
jgi:small subunit ribosomal protein S17